MRMRTYFKSPTDEHTVRLALQQSGRAVSGYETIMVRVKGIEACCRDTLEGINKRQQNTRTRGSQSAALEELRRMGQMLCKTFLTPEIEKTLLITRAENLLLEIDDHLVHIPWELLCIGQDFLCERFSMGRRVKTCQNIPVCEKRNLSPPFDMWILADPRGDLSSAAAEGDMIRDHMDEMNLEDPVVFTDLDPEIHVDEIQERIKDYDFVHFSGHGDHHPKDPAQSGWRLTTGTLTGHDIDEIAGGRAMPALIFSNACQSAHLEKWQSEKTHGNGSSGLVRAFMLAGVRHYLGTAWDITDEPGTRFAALFYAALVSGRTVGESVRQARRCMIEDEDLDISWAGYLLYGDPSVSYFSPHKNASEQIRLEISTIESKDQPYAQWLTCMLIIILVSAGYLVHGFLLPGNEEENGRICELDRPIIPPLRGAKGGVSLENQGVCLRKHPPAPPSMGDSEAFLTNETSISEISRLCERLGQLVDQTTSLSFETSAGKKKALIRESVSLFDTIRTTSEASRPSQAMSDGWTSDRVTMAVVYDLNKGDASLVAFAIQKTIHEKYPRIRLLDRRSLDKIKQEFELSASQWVGHENRLKPDLWTVRLFLFLEMIGSDVMMHLEETRTGEVLGFFHVRLEKDRSPFDQKEILSRELLRRLRTRYPLRGRVSHVKDQEVILNIGEALGVRMGQQFRIIGTDEILEVGSLRADGTCAVTKGSMHLEKGRKAEAVCHLGEGLRSGKPVMQGLRDDHLGISMK